MNNIYIPPYDHANIAKRLGDLPYESMNALDLGCGAYESDVARQIATMPFKSLTSVEGYLPDLEKITGVLAKEHIIKNQNVVDFMTNNKKTFDIVFMIDVIEHLPKETGRKILTLLDKYAKQIVIAVPVEPEGFHRKNSSENVLQEHISYWTKDEFLKLGYEVEVVEKAHSEHVSGDTYVFFDSLWCIKK